MTCRRCRKRGSAPSTRPMTAPTGPAGTTSKLGLITHDGGMDFDGNLWFTSNNPNRKVTVGRVDAKTGEVKLLKVNRNDGLAANAHGLVRDQQGNFWFDVNPGRRSLGRLDPKAEKIDVYMTPPNMSPLGGAVTLDVDGKGKVWASAPDGAVRFDPETERFTDFKSLAYKTARGTGITYGAAGDRDGNGWWTQMAFDTVGKGDVSTGKTTEVKLPVVQAELDRITPKRARSTTSSKSCRSTARCRQQGPRRMGTDKNADVLGSAIPGAGASPASTPRPWRRGSCRCRIRSRCSPITWSWTRATTCGAISGPTTRSSNTTRPPPSGRSSNCRCAGRDPPHRARRTQRHDQGDPAGLPHQPDGSRDLAQRGRPRRAQGAGRPVATRRANLRGDLPLISGACPDLRSLTLARPGPRQKCEAHCWIDEAALPRPNKRPSSSYSTFISTRSRAAAVVAKAL